MWDQPVSGFPLKRAHKQGGPIRPRVARQSKHAARLNPKQRERTARVSLWWKGDTSDEQLQES